MQRLDPPVEHLRAAGHGRDVGHGQTGIAQRPGGPAGRHQLEPARDEAASEVDEAGLVGDRQQRAAWRRDARRRRDPGRSSTWRPSGATATAPARSSATTCGSSRCSTAWMRSRSARSSSPGRTGTASWATIGPPSSVSSTRWIVTPVTRTPCASASPNGVGTRERRQQRRMRVEDPARERLQRRVARPAACSRPGRRHPAAAPARVSASAASSPPSTSAVSIPCSAAQSSAGHARSAKTRTIGPPSSPRTAAAWSARRLEPVPDTPTAIRALTHATDSRRPSM